MPPEKVADYFIDSPFGLIAGRLSVELGKRDFVSLRTHRDLKELVESTFELKPISLRLVIGETGGGKSWSFSWLWREFRDAQGTLVLGIPRLELRQIPERALMEAVFRGVRPKLAQIRAKIKDLEFQSENTLDGTSQYLLHALNDDSAMALLCGESIGRLKTLAGIVPPSKQTTEGSLRLLVSLFRVLRLLDYERVLVLIDEAETFFISYGRQNLLHFSNYLRGLYDEFELKGGERLPRVQVLFAGTTTVIMKMSPALVGKQSEAGDIGEALQRRLSPPFELGDPSTKEILEIAEYRIGKHRKQEEGAPYIPYDRDAILLIWESGLRNIGEFCTRLQRMYEIARDEDAERITVAHASMTVEEAEIRLEGT